MLKNSVCAAKKLIAYLIPTSTGLNIFRTIWLFTLRRRGAPLIQLQALFKVSGKVVQQYYCAEEDMSDTIRYDNITISYIYRARASLVGTMLQAGRSWVQDPVRQMNTFNLPNPPGRSRPWGSLSL
jgi:hypothetical protein